MQATHLVSASTMPDLRDRLGTISSMISRTFSSEFRADAIEGGSCQAEMVSASAPGVVLSHATMSPMVLRNTVRSTREKRKYYAYIANQTQVIKLERQGTLRVQPQELIIMSSDTSCETVTSRPYTTSGLVIDADLFAEHVPHHQALIAKHLSYPFGLNELLHATLDSCIAISRAGQFTDAGPRLVRSFLEMLALVKLSDDGNQPKLSTGLDIRRAQVKAFIEKYYHLPDLTISTIAERLQLTPRYVQLAFEADEVTPSEYLRRCRIDACARQLRDPAQQRRSITDIAFSNGFNSSSHFSTEFKRMRGLSPRAWRASPIAD